jgi:heptosyltransferase II
MSAPVQTILVRGVNWLGDAVMTIPALHRLREAYPAAHITLVTPAKLQDLWRRHPAVDRVLTFTAGEGFWSVGRRLRAYEFELALVLPNSPRSALEVWLAGARRRIGYARPWRNWLLTRALPANPGFVPMRKRAPEEVRALLARHAPPAAPLPASAHHLHHYLRLAAAAGANPAPLAPYLILTEAEVAEAAAKFGLGERAEAAPWIGLNAGAEYGPAKRWPLASFAEAAAWAHARTPCRWLIFGGPGDQPLAAELEARLRRRLAEARTARSAPAATLINLAGRTTLRELCALLQCCRAVLTNDSGPMHVAAAVGARVVTPFGSTAASLTGPGLPGDPRHAALSAAAPCSPCFLRQCPADFRCLTGITPEQAAQAILDRLTAP